MIENQKCVRCAATASWIGLWDSLLLALFKGVIGTLTHSRALMASALYSIHDVISGAAVIIGLKIAARPADEEHPYGHGNAEHIVSTLTSILILAATIFIMADSIKIISRAQHTPPHWAALCAAVISVLANEIIYRYNMCSVRHLNSPALLTHAKHHRADAISSAAVAIAILAGKMGFLWADPMVAIFEAVHLTILSGQILYHGGSGLMDRSIKESDIASIRKALSEMREVKKIKDIKTRQIGRNVWADVYVTLVPNKTVAEAHEISCRIRRSLKGLMKRLETVNVIYV